MPVQAVWRRFTEIFAAELQGLLDRTWNFERPLVFAHVFLAKMLGVRRDRDIWARITRRVDLWERGLHAGLVGGAEAEEAAKESRAASGGEGEGKALSRSYCDTVLSVNIRQAVR